MSRTVCAIASNIANVMTPGFQRQEVAFESQLAEIIENEDLKDYIKGQNSIEYKPPMVDVFTGDVHTYRTPTQQEKAYLKANTMEQFNPQVVTDIYSGTNSDGNNVELEREMMDFVENRYKVYGFIKSGKIDKFFNSFVCNPGTIVEKE